MIQMVTREQSTNRLMKTSGRNVAIDISSDFTMKQTIKQFILLTTTMNNNPF